MSDGLKILRDIGAQTIHNDTHISREYVQAIIHETFDGIQSVQFMGFVSILEREYKIDLSDLRDKGKAHFKEENAKIEKSEKIFVVAKQNRSYARVYILLGIILFLSFMYISSIAPELGQINDTKIEKVAKDAASLPVVEEDEIIEVENNTTAVIAKTLEVVTELNTTIEEPIVEELVVEPEPEVVLLKTLKILPKRKIWAGYINIKTNQKYQKVFRKEFAFDITKDWLLLFGAGTVKLEVNGENVKFSSRQNMRFKYVDGIFTKITLTEFKSLNKGRKW